MGYMVHHAIVVTCWDEKLIKRAHAKALKVFESATVSNIVCGVINGYQTFIVGPDGSKEGWGESATGDGRRAKYVAWLNKQCYEDDSTVFDWAHIQYGDDEGDNKILDDENTIKKQKTPGGQNG